MQPSSDKQWKLELSFLFYKSGIWEITLVTFCVLLTLCDIENDFLLYFWSYFDIDQYNSTLPCFVIHMFKWYYNWINYIENESRQFLHNYWCLYFLWGFKIMFRISYSFRSQHLLPLNSPNHTPPKKSQEFVFHDDQWFLPIKNLFNRASVCNLYFCRFYNNTNNSMLKVNNF